MPKREKARILAAMQQSTQNRGHQRAMATELDDQPRLLAAVLRAHMETCEFTREKVASMRQRARECPSYSLPTMVSCLLLFKLIFFLSMIFFVDLLWMGIIKTPNKLKMSNATPFGIELN